MQIAKMTICYLKYITHLNNLNVSTANVGIAIMCCPGCDVINFVMNLRLFINSFFFITKKSGTKM